MIDPNKFRYSDDEIRKELDLNDNDIIFHFGYENFLDESHLKTIQRDDYNLTTLFFRLRPDYLIRKNNKWFFYERKDVNANTLETTQLFLNKIMANNGINIFYRVKGEVINVNDIDLHETIIPPKYEIEFTQNILPYILKNFPHIKIKKTGTTRGSGDPFGNFKRINRGLDFWK